MYQSLVSPQLQQTAYPANYALNSTMRINALVEEKKIIRIVQPTIKAQIETRLENGRYAKNVLIHQGQLFISLQNIKNPQQREEIFSKIREVQILGIKSEDDVPEPIHRLLNGKTIQSSTNHFVSSLTLSAFLGGISGILAMAFAVIGMMVAGISNITKTGLQVSSIVFVVGTILGCAICTFVIWYRLKYGNA